MTPKPEQIWIHTTTRQHYRVLRTDINVKINGEWMPGVLYEPADGGGYYVRSLGNFIDRFVSGEEDPSSWTEETRKQLKP